MKLAFGRALIAVSLAGCSAGSGPPRLEAAPQDVAQKDDQFKPYREITTPQVRVGALPTALGLTLSARIDRQSGQLRFFLRTEVIYIGSGKRNYETARDSSAGVLRTERIAGNARCKPGAECTHDEIVTIELPESALRQARASGYRLKLFARNGPEIEIGIPGPQIVDLFDKVNAAAPGPATAQGPKGQR